MSYWPDKDEALLRQFVEQLKLRRYGVSYCCLLRDFQRFVSEDSPPRTLTHATLRAWLDKRKKQSSLDLVVHRAQLVSRFLDWLVACGAVASNPLAELRRQYDCRSTAAIVRALFSPQPNEALEALRPLPRYGSHLGEFIRKHVQRMQTLGLRYDESRFLRFDRFLQRRSDAAQEELSTLVREYAALGRSAAGKLIRLDVGRVLVKALSRTGVSGCAARARSNADEGSAPPAPPTVYLLNRRGATATSKLPATFRH